MRKPPLLLILAVLAAGGAAAIAFRDQLDLAVVEAWLAGMGAEAPVVFVGLYALATVFFLPGSLLTLAGGALFGPLWGTFYNLAGATLGAGMAFLIARCLARGHGGGKPLAAWIERKAGGRLQRLMEGIEGEGWRFVALVRLVPLLPFNVLNYALGLTRIKFGPYLLASGICMLPGAFAYTYLGYVGREAAVKSEGLVEKVLLALALLALVVFLPRLIRRLAKR